MFVLYQAFKSQNFAENLGNDGNNEEIKVLAGYKSVHWCEKLMSVVDNMGLKTGD